MAAAEQKIECVNRFIELANAMNNEDKSPELVSSGLMTACAVYATFVVTGNAGALKGSGVEKLAKLFSEELEAVQRAKIAQAKSEGREVSASSE